MNTIKYTKDLLEEVVSESKSIADVLRALNLKASGGNYSYLKKRIELYNISTSHFLGKSWSKGISPTNKRSKEDFINHFLCKNCHPIGSHSLKHKLYEFDLKNKKCEKCGIGSHWHGEYLSLHLDHINGESQDNRLENLRILCPNCHSQTDTFSGKKNKGKGKTKEEKLKDLDNRCIDCNCLITEGAKRCKSCKALKENKEKRTFELPTKEELISLLSKNSFTKVSKMFGVTDNAVRKWCNKYNISNKASDYKII